MTTVAALVLDGVVVMGADSLNNVYDRPIIAGARKIRRVPLGPNSEHGECLIAVCGNGALADMVSDLLDIDGPPSLGQDPTRWASGIARRCTALATELGLVDGGQLDGTLLMGWNGLLWTLTHAQAIPHADGVAAVGSGEGLAVGAIDALIDSDLTPSEIVLIAVRIAIARDKHSDGPVQLELLPPATPTAEG